MNPFNHKGTHFVWGIIVFFCPPAYFLLRGNLRACLVNGVFYLGGLLFAFATDWVDVAPLLWAIAIGHGGWDLFLWDRKIKRGGSRGTCRTNP